MLFFHSPQQQQNFVVTDIRIPLDVLSRCQLGTNLSSSDHNIFQDMDRQFIINQNYFTRIFRLAKYIVLFFHCKL